ncbi:MAG: hypothetical protein KatS3mg089_0392 [Patescibacteria group bacterium]|nr:MAG: hypothetical protein KatS3mg089_0392 [Patescibacteria group bacterium]
MDFYPLISFKFLLYFLIFLISVYLTFYLPGSVIVSFLKIHSLGMRILLPTIVGMVLWGMQGYLLGYLQLRFLTYIYLLVMISFAYKRNLLLPTYFLDGFLWIRRNIFLTLLVLLGIIVQLIPVVASGTRYQEGVRFFGVNGVDGIMHLAFIRGIIHRFPPFEPGAFDHPLTNYHYWSDLIISELIRVWHLPTSHVFFQYMPILLSLLTAIAGYQVMRSLGFSHNAGVWAIFFLFFGGDGAYLLMLLVHNKLSFASPAIDNGATQFLNMPNALARPVFLTSIITLQYWFKEKRLVWGILMVLLSASLWGIKVYYGIFTAIGLSLIVIAMIVITFVSMSKKKSFINAGIFAVKENIMLLSVLGLFVVVSALIYFPPNKGAGGLKVYPLEWPKIFLGPGGINWGEWWLRRQVYEQAKNIRNLLVLDIIAILVAMISIHGTRLIGLFLGRNIYKKLGWRNILFFIPGLLIFHVLGLYTLQEAGEFNVFNFFVVGTVILSIFSAMVVERLFYTKNLILAITAFVVVILTIPRVIHETISYLPTLITPKNTSSTLISNAELEGLNFIRENTPQSAIVQSHPKDNIDQETPYVSFFSDRFTYLSGTRLQKTHNQPVEYREKELKKLFESRSSPEFHGIARNLGINVIYLKKNPDQELFFERDNNLIKKIFENKEVVIYKINN